MAEQVRAAPDCFVSHPRKILGPVDQREGHNPQNNTLVQSSKIQIREITQREFCEAYKKGETTAVMKFSQKKNKFISKG